MSVRETVRRVGGRLGRPAHEVEKLLQVLHERGLASRQALVKVDEKAALAMHLPLRFVKALQDELRQPDAEGSSRSGAVADAPSLGSARVATPRAPGMANSAGSLEGAGKAAASIHRHLQRLQAAREKQQQQGPRSESWGGSSMGSAELAARSAPGGYPSPISSPRVRQRSPPRGGSRRLPGDVLARIRSPRRGGSAQIPPGTPRCVIQQQVCGSARVPVRDLCAAPLQGDGAPGPTDHGAMQAGHAAKQRTGQHCESETEAGDEERREEAGCVAESHSGGSSMADHATSWEATEFGDLSATPPAVGECNHLWRLADEASLAAASCLSLDHLLEGASLLAEGSEYSTGSLEAPQPTPKP